MMVFVFFLPDLENKTILLLTYVLLRKDDNLEQLLFCKNQYLRNEQKYHCTYSLKEGAKINSSAYTLK